MTTENQGINLDSRQAILHILRNPYGWSDEAVRDVRLQAAKELERLWRQERRAQQIVGDLIGTIGVGE
jgi:hypothetical protein